MSELNTGQTDETSIDKVIAEFKQSLGRFAPLSLGDELFGRRNEMATRDAIRHFANGIGDANPLWRNDEYAKNTRYGGIIGPPLSVSKSLRYSEGKVPIINSPYPKKAHFIDNF